MVAHGLSDSRRKKRIALPFVRAVHGQIWTSDVIEMDRRRMWSQENDRVGLKITEKLKVLARNQIRTLTIAQQYEASALRILVIPHHTSADMRHIRRGHPLSRIRCQLMKPPMHLIRVTTIRPDMQIRTKSLC